MIKRISLLFLLFASILSQKALAVSIVLDGTQTLLSGHKCQTVKYRFGTQSSYLNQDIDLILEVTSEDNEYSQGKCVDIVDNVIGFNLRDKDDNNNRAYMDVKVTVVKKGTQTPINVDTITVTNFDLDNNPSQTDTDDVYYKNPTKVYLSKFTNVTQSSGNFFSNYTTKLKGQSTGNCNDDATLLQKECRGGVSFDNSSSFYARVQNDNAYGNASYNSYNYRLIQFSFELKDLTPLMSEIEVPCEAVNYSTSNNSWIEGSVHNGYSNNLNISKTIKVIDAQSIKVTVNGETENNYDWIYIYDKNGNQVYKDSGNLNSTPFIVSSSEVTIKLTSDHSITKSGATVTIEGLGCEEEPTVSISDSVDITEGDSGDKDLIFTINLDNPASNGGVTVEITPTDITANEGEDYTRTTSSIFFAQGETEQTVVYKIHGDTSIEENETFSVELHNPQNAQLNEDNKTAIGTIINDDSINPIGCLQTAWMFQNKPTDINALNLVNGQMSSVKNNISDDNINALGFNKKDGYFWGYNHTKRDGTVSRIGMNNQGDWIAEEFVVSGLSGFDSYVGDIDNNGHLYLKVRGSGRRVVVIDLDPNSPNYLTKIDDFNLNFDLGTADWGFNPKDNKLYAVNNGNGTKYLYKIDPSNGHQLSKQNTLLTGNRGFGASFFDANGFYYVYDNRSGNIYRIDVANSPNAVLFATADIVSLNDGAMCTDAEFKFDFGDLPENYPTKLESNGARHSLPTYGEPTVYLGAGVSNENNGKPSTDANLDENDDGVKIDNSSLQNKIINAGETTTLQITTHGNGYLSAWIDWNADGDFNDTNEQIAQNIDGSSGLITLDVIAPNSSTNRVTYARFRYSNQENLTPIGSAINGEVEDYKINITGEPILIAEYRFDECSWNGTLGEVKDNTQYNRHGTAKGEANTIADAVVGRSGKFNGVSDNDAHIGDFVEIENHALLNKGGAFTVATWFKATSLRGWNGIISTTSRDDRKGWNIEIDTIHTSDAREGVLAIIGNDMSAHDRYTYLTSDIKPNVGEWHHVVLVHGSDNSNKLYIDGVFKNSLSKEVRTSSNPLDIAKFYTDKTVDWYFDGQIDEVKIWEGTLSQNNITIGYNNENNGKNWNGTNREAVVCTLPPTISISNESITEGDSGEKNLRFTVFLDKTSDVETSFDYQIFDGNSTDSYKNATSPSDYTNNGLQHVSLSPNEQNITIDIPIKGDREVEDDEKFILKLSNLTGLIEGNITATMTIINDDSAISWGTPTDLDEDNDGILDEIEFGDYPNLVQNPSFEADNCMDATRFPNGFTGRDGTFLGDDYNNNQIAHWNYTSNIDCWVEGHRYALTNYGTQYIDLQGNINVHGSGDWSQVEQNHLTQTVTTIPGKTYRFSFWWGEDVGHKINEPIVFTMKVIDATNNTMLSNETLHETAGGRDQFQYAGPNQWYNYEAFFVATSTQTKLDFSATPPTGNLSAGADIDMVSVKEVADHDEDGVPDFLDLDSDNDGIPDNIEAQRTQEYIKPNKIFNANGVDTAYANLINGGLTPVDTDVDGTADYLDLDSDDDDIFDIEESGLGNNDSNNDGRTNTEVGNNGLDNSATHEHNDTLADVNGMAYESNEFKLKDSDDDTQANGSDATPMGVDFDYRDNEIQQQEAFTCNETLYLSNRTELGTGSGDSGATWLHRFNAIGASYTPIGNGFISADGGYNAIGYNVQDNFIYALYGNHLLKIDKNGVVKDLGAVEGLPSEQLYAGEFDREGFYYVTGTGGADNKMYKIDIEQKKVVKTITLSASVRFWDMAIDTTGEYFYTMLIQDGNSDFQNDKFAKIKISDGTVTTVGDSHSDLPSYISLIFSDAEGKVVALSQDGKLYEIMPQSGKVYFTKPFASLSFYNDGTSCPNANITLPPHPPRLSINNVSKLEGDSGETIFDFTVTADQPFSMMPMSGAMFYYKVVDGDEDEVVPPHEVALRSDHDFQGKRGIGIGMNMFGNGVSINLSVTVYGDEKVEKDEEFYVEIYSPQLPPMMSPKFIIDKNIGVGTIINDDYSFNIERVNSNNENNQTQIVKESLYTQITDKDFDYSIVSYDGQNVEYNVNNILFKIELLDMNTTDENNILYTKYYYVNDELNKRFPIEYSDDLKIQKATREARFKIYYISDVNSTEVNKFYNYEDAYENIQNNSNYAKGYTYSRDSFAIRPAYYSIELNDLDENNQSVTYATNYNTQTQELKLVAGYNYELKAYAIINDFNHTIATHYTAVKSKELNVTLDFDETGTTSCADTNTSEISNYNFLNGKLSENFSHNNVGKYTLHIEDINWTYVDKDKYLNQSVSGCILNSTSNRLTNGKYGCNIGSNEGNLNDINMIFKPYKFEFIDTTLSNINGNGKDYLYMSDLNLSTGMGVKLSSTIKALGEQGTVLSNFTNGCIEENPNLTLKLKFEFEDDRGTWSDSNMTLPQSINKKELMPQQIVAFNDYNISEVNMTIMKNININKKDFTDENNGSMSINIFYNMEKLFDSPTNPIKVNFISLDLNTTNLEANIEGEKKRPIGTKDIDTTKIFYFARVASYATSYPATNKKSIETPLFIEVYCRTKDVNQSWCRDTMELTQNGIIRHGQKTYQGWYLAQQHDTATEGRVHTLISQHNDISVNHTANIPPFVQGKIDSIETFYNKSGDLSQTIKAQIVIDTDVWLRFNKEAILGMPEGTPSYIINMKSISSTTGAGSTGNLIESVKKVEHNGKISW